MRNRLIVALLVVAAVSFMPMSHARAAEDDVQGAKAAVGKFHEALNLLFTGDAGPIKAVWAHADDGTSMGPVGGMEVGWAQIEPYWDR